ncbi:MAG: alpha/beta hydrolase [Xanthobacteraceae bacterium]|nr:alpha/beta hydrolase [Xanthobacteraceae bacterium]
MPAPSSRIPLPPAPAIARADLLPGAPQGDGTPWQPALLVREQTATPADRARPVLFVHGATFPSDCALMYRFGGVSWADALNRAGFAAFAFDFAGFGGSERYPAMGPRTPPAGTPLGRADHAAGQIARVVDAVLARTGAGRLSIIAHSWGSIAAGLFATRHPRLVDRLVFFGPIMRRSQLTTEPALGPWRLVSVDEQLRRFTEDVPLGAAPVLERDDVPAWAQRYLDSDPTSRSRTPPSVKTPNGPVADIAAAWAGRLAYDPARIQAPVAVIRGAWDSLCTDADAAWLHAALSSTTMRDVTVPRGTHLMHLERGRHALYDAANAFLSEGRTP